jgi:type IV secretion system protein VirB4
MLNLKRTALGFDSRSRGLSEILPWLVLIRPGVVLNKDGSLLACFLLRGMNVEGCEEMAIDHGADAFEQALRSLDHRFTLWSTVLRREIRDYPQGTFANPGSAAIDALHRQKMQAKRHFSNRHFVSILFSLDETRDGFFGALAQASGEAEGSLFQRLWSTASHQLFHGNAFRHDEKMLQKRITLFEEMLSQWLGGLQQLGPERLEGVPLTGFLHEMTSPATHRTRPPELSPNDYLDTALGEDRIVIQGDHLRFEGVGGARYAAALAVKGWPSATFPGMLDAVLTAPTELTLSQVFRFVDQDAAKRYIKNVQRFHLNLQKSLFSYVREAVSGEESVVRDTGRAVSAEDARHALTDIVAARRVFGYHNLTVLVFSSDTDTLDETLGTVATSIRTQGYLLLRERLHLNSAWSGTLPGQWGELVRWHFISTANWSDLCPIRSSGSGLRTNRYLSQQTGRHAPALSLFSTRSGSPYYFNLHHQDLAHAFVVGPSRSGKSVWVNFLISQFQKYHPVRTVIFDKDRSCRIPTLLQGGQCVDVAQSSLQLNPLSLVGEPRQRSWLARWLEILLCARGRILTAEDDRSIAESLNGLAALSPRLHQLKSLHGLLPRHLRVELEPWLAGGILGGHFDHAQDDFVLSPFTCIEMSTVLRDHRVARAFLEYAFFRIEQALDAHQGVPTLIYVEEAWFMLSDPYFSNRIRDWLKTIPKKLGSLILATQSLDDLSGSDIFSTIADNIPTRIFLPNHQARVHRALYHGQFGLNDAQIGRIEQATEKCHYYVSTPEENHLLEVKFSPQLLAWLRSDARAQALFEQHRASDRADWVNAYLKDIVAETK